VSAWRFLQEYSGSVEIHPVLYPLDRPEVLRRLMRSHGVCLAICHESEWWPGLLEACRAEGVSVAWSSARLRPRTARRLVRWPGVRDEVAALLRGFAQVWAATEVDAVRIGALLGRPVPVGGDFKALAGQRDASGFQEANAGALAVPLMSTEVVPNPTTIVPSVQLTRVEVIPLLPLGVASLHLAEVSALLEVLVRRADFLAAPPDGQADPGGTSLCPLLIQLRHPGEGARVARRLRRAGWRTVRCADEVDLGRALDSNEDELVVALGAEESASLAILLEWFGSTPALLRRVERILMGGSLAEGIGMHDPREALRLGRELWTGPFVEPLEELCAELDRAGLRREFGRDHMRGRDQGLGQDCGFRPDQWCGQDCEVDIVVPSSDSAPEPPAPVESEQPLHRAQKARRARRAQAWQLLERDLNACESLLLERCASALMSLARAPRPPVV
jgi:hypothetical protein